MWGLDAARPERGASATEGRGGRGVSPGLAGRLRPKAGDTPGAGIALAPQCRGALQSPRVSRPLAAQRQREDHSRTNSTQACIGSPLPALWPQHIEKKHGRAIRQ